MIESLHTELWPGTNVDWDTVNHDVNILVGINGSGKTTLVKKILDGALQGQDTGEVIYVPSVDNISVRDGRKKVNALSQDLDFYLYDMKSGPSLMKFKMRMFESTVEIAGSYAQDMENFFMIVNGMFSESGKTLYTKETSLMVEGKAGNIPVDVLSSGEKHLLLVLLRVFLTDKKPCVILIDEPENSLHIRWQSNLIDALVSLNPNAQFIITTHSPSMFGRGWGDKAVYMEDIVNTH